MALNSDSDHVKTQMNILMIEDDLHDARLVEWSLKQFGLNFKTVLVATKEDYTNELETKDYDVILSDDGLSQISSAEALQIRNTKKINTPFLLLTSAKAEDNAIKLIHEGATDYILKDRLKRLPIAITQAIQRQKDQLEKDKAEQDLLTSIERFKLAGKATTDTIWDWNVTTGELILGESFEKLFGHKLTAGDTDINSWKKYLHPADKERVLKGVYDVLNSEEKTSWSDQYRYTRSDGTYATVIDKGLLLRCPITNKPYRMVGAMQDITQLTKNIEDLRQFSFIISHNFNAPLTNLLAILKLIDHSNLHDDNLQLIKMMEASTSLLKQTIDHLSQVLIIKSKEADIEHIAIEEVIRKTLDTLPEELRQVNPEISLQLNQPVLRSNRAYTESIFQNLITNALKYRSPGRKPHIKISTEKSLNERTLLTFSDNGLGIDIKRHKEKLFGMYQRFHSNDTGKGMGLFLVKSQITALGGSIDIKSRVDNGTTFLITI